MIKCKKCGYTDNYFPGTITVELRTEIEANLQEPEVKAGFTHGGEALKTEIARIICPRCKSEGTTNNFEVVVLCDMCGNPVENDETSWCGYYARHICPACVNTDMCEVECQAKQCLLYKRTKKGE